MELPTEIREAVSINPDILLMYGIPKSGKTVITAQLPNHLLLELEPGGANYVDARVVEVTGPKMFNDVLNTIKSSESPVADFLIVDTISKLDEWSEIVGTLNYMDKKQGKDWNLIKGKRLSHTDKRFETVHEMGMGFGYKHSRDVMVQWYAKFEELIALKKVKHIILIAHVKDKFIETKSGDVVDSIDINLTGKVKTIYASKVDALGHFHRKGKEGLLDFDNEFKVSAGGRCKHLNGQFVISEKQDNGDIITFWDKIYLKTKKN